MLRLLCLLLLTFVSLPGLANEHILTPMIGYIIANGPTQAVTPPVAVKSHLMMINT